MDTVFKKLKPSREGIKVFNPATKLDLKPEGEEVAMSNYWIRRIQDKDVVEVYASADKKEKSSK